jgi:hypothetical protein
VADTDFTGYLAWSLAELLERLALVASALVDLYPLEASARVEELRSKRDGWMQSEETSVNARDRSATYEALAATTVKIETENQIVALREEKSFLLTMIDVRLKEAGDGRQP